jgi:FKBP-type peptidyl-prolyl cis-trans isomerase FklB
MTEHPARARHRSRWACGALGAAFLLLASCGAGEKAGPRSIKEKESYALGFQFGENLKYQKAELDMEAYMKGLRDALEGGGAAMTQDEIREAVAGFRRRLAEAQAKPQPPSPDAQKNLAAGRAFLAENAKKPGVVTTASGLQFRVLAPGSGPSPKRDSIVIVRYRGRLIDGTEFENTFDRPEALPFRVEGVIPGWTEALLLMKAGARWEIAIPAELAYGERGAPPRIPPGSALVFEIELVEIQ